MFRSNIILNLGIQKLNRNPSTFLLSHAKIQNSEPNLEILLYSAQKSQILKLQFKATILVKFFHTFL